ncbi:hypothetical protein [Thiohalophilus sp.]|uniref:hypothetical protein n=1 Tax=Thiohalophilus sp. TaxID=3028392 RepID=UPI002ACE4C3E|nr:hypothetical protein [Thiohalophilus sp.]MDZ7802394.1 hypothetical protein [Thiohalophilus sp.]
MERDHLKKENDELKHLDDTYREKSVTIDQVNTDIEQLDECWEKIQKIITRVEVEDLPEEVQLRFVERLNRIQSGSERFNNMHMELLLIFNDPIIN